MRAAAVIGGAAVIVAALAVALMLDEWVAVAALAVALVSWLGMCASWLAAGAETRPHRRATEQESWQIRWRGGPHSVVLDDTTLGGYGFYRLDPPRYQSYDWGSS